MSTRLRHCVIYLLIALLPLQAAAATRLALCAEMAVAMSTTSTVPAESLAMEHCERMDMSMHAAADDGSKSATPHAGMGCWLGSNCVAAMMLLALPVTHAVAHAAPIVPNHLPLVSHYHSVIAEGLQRPPATL